MAIERHRIESAHQFIRIYLGLSTRLNGVHSVSVFLFFFYSLLLFYRPLGALAKWNRVTFWFALWRAIIANKKDTFDRVWSIVLMRMCVCGCLCVTVNCICDRTIKFSRWEKLYRMPSMCPCVVQQQSIRYFECCDDAAFFFRFVSIVQRFVLLLLTFFFSFSHSHFHPKIDKIRRRIVTFYQIKT